MFARVLASSVLLAGCAAPAASVQQAPPPTDLAASCRGRDGWSDPAPPAHVFGNVWDVGTCGITVLLVTSDQGHILIDGATDKAVAAILANIRAAGFAPTDIRWILSTHEHNDHVGGLAGLKAATGAKIAAGKDTAEALARGQIGAEDPQATIHQAFPPVAADRVLTDGDAVAVGPLRLTMHATPVHSPGSTSWTWTSTDNGGRSQTVTYADSLTTISADEYRFADHRRRIAAIRSGLDTAAALPCGILLTPHPSASNMFERLAGRAPLADPGACRAYADAARTKFEARLAKEAGK